VKESAGIAKTSGGGHETTDKKLMSRGREREEGKD